LLLYYLAKTLVENRFFALGAALLFLLHPIHSLPIFWVSGRTDMICALFYLATLILFIEYIRGGVKTYQLLSVTTFLLAIFAKEMAVSLPFIIFAYVVIFDQSERKQRWFKSLKLSGPYLLIIALFILFRFTYSTEVLSNKFHGAISPVQFIKNVAAYLGLLIIPGGHIEIANYLKAHPVVFIMLAGGGLLVSAILFYWIRKSKALMFFCLFLLLTLLPVSRLLICIIPAAYLKNRKVEYYLFDNGFDRVCLCLLYYGGAEPLDKCRPNFKKSFLPGSKENYGTRYRQVFLP
jgi:hypothetical protein